MKTKDILTKATGIASKATFKLKKHSPEILIVAGVVGTVVSAVMACKATTKVNDILEDTKEQLDAVHDCLENEELAEKYTHEDGKKDTAIIYAQTAVKMAKLYAPAVALGALSLTCVVTSNNILRKRNAALAAAYATVDHSFKEYRKRVVDRFGEEVEKELRYNVKAKELVETDESGNEVTRIVKVPDTTGDEYSEFMKVFDETNENWQRDASYNLMFLRAQQNWANDKLRANGYLFLNDVYDALGFQKTKAGQVVGWIYDPDNQIGDNYVDFGIYNLDCQGNRDFLNGWERNVILDFNVDGNIWELMP